MIKPNFMEKLLDGVEVEWKSLGEVTLITIGEFVHKNNQITLGKYPVYNGGKEPTGYYDKYNNIGNRIIVSARGANAGYVNKISKPYWAGNSCYSIDIKDITKLNWEFIFFYLKHSENKLIDEQQKGSIPSVSKKQMESISIPIPPLKVQEEIVRILDTFAELTARKKQYNYYQTTLLNFDNEIVRIPITDLCSIKARIGWQGLTRKEYLSEGDYYLVTGVDFNTDHHIDFKHCHYVSQERYDQDINIQIHEGDLLITKDGTLGKIAIIDKEPDKPTTLNSGVFVLRIKDNRIILKYLYHYLISDYFTQFIETVKTGSTVPHLTQNGLVNLKIPIPPIAEQERIVSILDKFDALTTSITEGLPREIELRQKQYEYYRNILLSFPKEEA